MYDGVEDKYKDQLQQKIMKLLDRENFLQIYATLKHLDKNFDPDKEILELVKERNKKFRVPRKGKNRIMTKLRALFAKDREEIRDIYSELKGVELKRKITPLTNIEERRIDLMDRLMEGIDDKNLVKDEDDWLV